MKTLPQKVMFFLLGAFFLSACATTSQKEPTIPMKWPEPPLKTRIEFMKTLASEGDVGWVPSWKEKWITFLTGKRSARRHLFQPADIVVSDDGQRIYVSDYGQLQVFIFDLEEKKIRLRGPYDRPFGLALDDQENLYVAEQISGTIQVSDRTGKHIRSIRAPELIRPTDIVIDRVRERLYVADPAKKGHPEHTVKIFDLSGKLLGQVGRGKGEEKGQLYFPTYLTLGSEGNLYVTSTMNARVDVFSPDGAYLKTFGERGNSYGMFDKPKGVALDSLNNLYVVDSNWSNVQIFNQQGQVLLFFGGRGAYPGLLKNPTGIAIDKKNRIYVADLLNDRVSVYQLKNTVSGEIKAPVPSQKIPEPSGEKEVQTLSKHEDSTHIIHLK